MVHGQENPRQDTALKSFDKQAPGSVDGPGSAGVAADEFGEGGHDVKESITAELHVHLQDAFNPAHCFSAALHGMPWQPLTSNSYGTTMIINNVAACHRHQLTLRNDAKSLIDDDSTCSLVGLQGGRKVVVASSIRAWFKGRA